MLLHESRRAARTSRVGRTDPARRSGPLAVGPRSDRGRHAARASRRWRRGRFGPYTIQAAIAAVHAEAADAAATDWTEIVGLYDVLLRADASPVIELNRAVAVAMRDGPAAGLALIDAILERGDLPDYRLAHAARAELCRRLGRTRGRARLVRARPRAHAAGAGAAVSRAAARRALKRMRAVRFGHASDRPDPTMESRMKYLCLVYLEEAEAARRARPRVHRLRRRVQEQRAADRRGGAATGRDRDDGAGPATASCRSPTVRSPRRKSSSRAST